jgi:RNA polymerase sigma-70 factor (ECF subfamily)
MVPQSRDARGFPASVGLPERFLQAKKLRQDRNPGTRVPLLQHWKWRVDGPRPHRARAEGDGGAATQDADCSTDGRAGAGPRPGPTDTPGPVTLTPAVSAEAPGRSRSEGPAAPGGRSPTNGRLHDAGPWSEDASSGDDRSLVAGLKAHDGAAIRQAYRLYSDGVYRYALLQLRDKAAAEDVAGEVFLRLLDAIERYEYRGVPLQAYVFRIARNLVVDQQRRWARAAPLEVVPETAALSASPAHLAEQRLSWHELQAALGQLTDDQRQVVHLKFVEDLDNKHVAEVIGKNEGAVKSLQHRALASLRRILERGASGA